MATTESRIENLEAMVASIITKLNPSLRSKLETYLRAAKASTTTNSALTAKREEISKKIK